MVQPLNWRPCVLDGTPDRCQGRQFARLHLQQVAGRKGLHCCSIRSHRNLGRSGSLSSFGPEPPREPRLGSDPLLGSPAFLCAGAGLKPAELDPDLGISKHTLGALEFMGRLAADNPAIRLAVEHMARAMGWTA